MKRLNIIRTFSSESKRSDFIVAYLNH